MSGWGRRARARGLGGAPRNDSGGVPRRLQCAALASALAIAGWSGTSQAGQEGADLTLEAEFVDVGPLIVNNDVQVSGVKAGIVRSIRVHEGKARVRFSVTAPFTPVHADATIRLRPVSILGEQLLDLKRGTPTAAPLRNGDFIPLARTSKAVEIQEVLDALDQPTAAALAAMITGLGEGLDGHGADTAATLSELGPSLDHTDALLAILNGQNELLAQLIDRTEPVATALAADRGVRLDTLVARARALLRATAAARSGLDGGLRRLPESMDTTEAALAELRALSGEAVPLLASLRPVTGDLSGISRDLSNLAGAAPPALAALNPVLDRAGEFIAAGRPVVADLAPAGGDLETTARSARAVIEPLPPGLQGLFDAVEGLASATAPSDALTHLLRIHTQLGPATLGLPVARAAGARSPLVTTASPPPGPWLPILAVADPGVLRAPLGLPSPPAAPPADPGSATGLTFAQERNLMRFLLGVG